MALGHFQSHAVDSAGNVLAGATVTVTNELTGGLATLKSDYAGASSKANGAGFTTDSDGYFDFYTTGGFYKIVVEKDGASKTWRYVAVGTLSAYDLDILLNAKRKTVRAATTANIAISTALNNGDTLDGVTLATGNLVLVKDQTNKYENGIYVVGVTPARHSDFDTYNEHVGAWIAVSEGTTNANRLYVNTDNLGGTLDTTEINFTRVIPNGGSAPLDSPAFTGSFQWTGYISPTSLSADQDDYNPSGLSGAVVIRQATGAFYSINGLQGGSDGRVILIKNAGSNPLQIGAERASSTAAYRFAMSADLLIGPGEAAMFEYDSTSSRWVLIGRKPRPEHLEVTPDPFPTVPHKPTVYADWSTMRWLDRYFTFTRASVGTYLDKKGILKTATAGVPRFHTIYSSGECGLLIEGSRTNLFLRSQEFDAASWTKTAMTVTADSVVAPDGATTADTLVATGGGFANQGVTVSSGATVAISIFAKRSNVNWLRIRVSATNTRSVWFNLATGAIGAAPSTSADLTAFSSSIESLPNGWYRCIVVVTTSGITTLNVAFSGAAADGSAAVNTDEVYAWGAQLESGAFPSSYIPTVGSTVTRSADVCYRNISDVVNANEFAFYIEAIQNYPAAGDRVIGAVGPMAASFGQDIYASHNASNIIVGPGGGPVNVSISATANASTKNKVMVSMASNNARLVVNGTLGTPDLSNTLPASIDRLSIGPSAWGTSTSAFSLIQKAAYWSTAQLSNAQHQTVTT